MMGLANKDGTRLWLRANIVPLTREVDNPDGSKRTKLRPIALPETPLKLIESFAAGTAGMDGAEAMINAVTKFLKKRHKQNPDAG